MSTPNDERIPEGWVPLTGDDADERIERMRIGKEKGIIVDQVWYVPYRSTSSSKSTIPMTQATPDASEEHVRQLLARNWAKEEQKEQEEREREKRNYKIVKFVMTILFGFFTLMWLFGGLEMISNGSRMTRGGGCEIIGGVVGIIFGVFCVRGLWDMIKDKS